MLSVQVLSTVVSMTTKTISYTEARANLAKTIDEVCDDVLPIVVSKRGKRVVMMPESEYNAMLETLYVTRGGNAQHLRESLEQVDRGEMRAISLDEIKAMSH